MPMTATPNTTRMAMNACHDELLANARATPGAIKAPTLTPATNPARLSTPMMKP